QTPRVPAPTGRTAPAAGAAGCAARAGGGPARSSRRLRDRAGLGRLPVLVLEEPGRDQAGQRLDGGGRVGPPAPQIPPGAALGGHRRQTQDALPIDFIAIMADPDLRLEPRRQLHEFLGGPEVQAETVEDLDLAMGDNRLVAHQRLDRPGPWTKDHRARLTL